jgi:hypothetical protein
MSTYYEHVKIWKHTVHLKMLSLNSERPSYYELLLVSTTASYSGGMQFKYRLFWLKFLVVLLVSPDKVRDSTFSYATTTFLHIPSNSQLTTTTSFDTVYDNCCS